MSAGRTTTQAEEPNAQAATTTEPRTVDTAAQASALPAGQDTTVTRIVDGDTIVVDGGVTVRLIGIDTPETKDPRKPVQCFGVEAARRTTGMIGPGTRVRLVYDVERRDRYDRTLAYVYRRSDGLFVNLALVEEGFAQVATFPPNVAHAEEFLAAQREAREANRGLWAACGGEEATTTAKPTTATNGSSDAYYGDCDEARRAGAAPMREGEPGYRRGLDRDGDGVACE